MKITIYQKFRLYKKDSIKYLVFEILNKPFVIFFLVCIALIILHYLNKTSYIKFFPEIIGLLTFSLSIGVLGMILYSILSLFRTLRKINKEVNTLYEGRLHINLNNDCIIIQKENDEYFFRRNWNQIKEFIVIGKTAYLIPIKKNDFMIRINQNEIIEGKFADVVSFINSKWKTK